MDISKEQIEKERLNFENKYIRSYDRLKYKIRTYLNISNNLEIFYSRIFDLIANEISRLVDSQSIRYKYVVVIF